MKKKNKRILFTTGYLRDNKNFEFYSYHTRKNLKVAFTSFRHMQPGLRFIKQNFPQIEILEFPTWDKFKEVLSRGWDIVGFSFFIYETNEVLEMVNYAREMGVNEIWGGNYGVLTPAIQSSFDRIFTGYSEEELSKALGTKHGDLIHPPLIDTVGIKPMGGPFIKYGWLYTTRGCPLKCTFCQTPSFAPKIVKTPIESIDRVIDYYKNHGVQSVFIYDEFFGIDTRHASEVTATLAKHKMPWGVMTRSEVLIKNFDEWYENGLDGVMFGIESMNPKNLKDIKKRGSIEKTEKTLDILKSHDCYSIGTYMIGFDNDTPESIEQDFIQLKKLQPDFMKLFVTTPFPQTPLWDEIDKKYGINTSDWSKYDGKHLVWNHTDLSSEDVERLLNLAYDTFNPQEYTHRLFSRQVHRRKNSRGISGVHNFFLSALHNRLYGKTDNRVFF